MSVNQRANVLTEVILVGASMLLLRNNDGTVMDATGGSGKFHLVAGGWGTGTLKAIGQAASGDTQTDDLMLTFTLPKDFQKTAYTTGEKAFSIKIFQKTDPVANTTANIDVECYESDGKGGVIGSDLVTTTVITNNSTTWIEHEFTITPTLLEPGDEMVIHIRTIVDDSGGASSAIAHIGKITLQYAAKM